MHKYIFRKILLFMIFLLTVIPASAENNNKPVSFFDDNVTIRTSVKNSFFQFRLLDPEQEGEDIKYSPNVETAFGVLFKYKYLELSVSKNYNFHDESGTKGDTEYYDMQLYYFVQNFAAELYHQKYKGYYLKDPELFGYAEGHSKTKRPDITTLHQGFNVYYIYSDDYSLNAAMNQGEKQNELAGSFMIMSSVNRVKLNSEFSLIPDNQQIYYNEDSMYTGGNYVSFAVSPGIGITIPYENLFVSFVMFIGYGKSYSKYENLNGPQTSVDNVLKVNAKFSLGYNADNLFYGLVCNYDSTNLVLNGRQFENSFEAGFVEFFLGTRF
jgi:hypothetical protein